MTKKVETQSISTSSRCLQFTASLQNNKGYIITENTFKDYLIHKVSALMLKEKFFGEDHKELIELLKTTDYKVNNEPMIIVRWENGSEKICESYIEYANKLYNQYKPNTIEIEKKINITLYGESIYVVIDLLMISDDYTIIVDLRSGKAKVETDETQMILYAIGVIEEQLKEVDENRFLGDYITSIYQPLANNVVENEYSLKEITYFYHSYRNKNNEMISKFLQNDYNPFDCHQCDHKVKCIE